MDRRISWQRGGIAMVKVLHWQRALEEIIMCNCQTMARDLSETMGGKYPASLHAPLCDDYSTAALTHFRTQYGLS